MSLADTTGRNVDGHFPRLTLESARPSSAERSPEAGHLAPDSHASDDSVDYSRSQCSCGSLGSRYDYSEEFLSEYSETAAPRSRVEKAVVKAHTGEKKAQNVAKFSQPKGLESSVERKHNGKAPVSNSQVNAAQQRDTMTHRILSARLHKIKELKNELTDIHRKLEVTVAENQFLKQVQLRHLKAIGRYENSQNNLPQIVAKHQNEVKNLRQLLRKSQAKERAVSRKLRETDMELLRTKDALQTLQRLSEDKNLAEREELTQRLSSLTAKMEAGDKKIQSLEKQLRLKNKAFNRQLTLENRKTAAAQAATKLLQMEVNRVQHKLKEKDRELEIRNIYANRILKNLHDIEDYPKASSTKSIQVDRKSVPVTTVRHQETQKPEGAPALPAKGGQTAGNAGHKGRAAETLPAAPRGASQLPRPAEAKRKCQDSSKEEEPLEVQAPPEHVGRQREKESEEPKATSARESLLSPKGTPAVHPARDSHQEGQGVRERLARRLQASDGAEKADCGGAASSTRAPLRPRKHYSFTEATENLHQGLPAAGVPASHSGKRRANARHAQEERPEPAAGAAGIYEPSCGKPPGAAKARDTAFLEKKNSLMEELFGPGCVLRHDPPPRTDVPGGPEGTLTGRTKQPRPPPSQASANNAFGDSKATVANAVPSASPAQGTRKVII